MNALIVFDAQSWSAGQIALAIAGTLAKSAYVRAVDVADMNALDLQGVDILILGCATQRWKPTPAMQGFLNSIPEGSLNGISLALFDTRFPVPRLVTGSVARAMANGVRKRGGSMLVPPQSVPPFPPAVKQGRNDSCRLRLTATLRHPRQRADGHLVCGILKEVLIMKEEKMLWKQAWIVLACATILALLVSLLVVPVSHAQQARWYTEFFANTTLSGPSVLTRTDKAIDFNWGTGSPAAGVPADGFSARWTRNEWFEAGTYRFWSRSDDGFRLWVGDIMVFDNWVDQQGGWQSRDLYLNPGPYAVRAEYYENVGGARVSLNWERIGGGRGWQAEYYANQNLSGSPALRRTDSTINFDWKDGAPAPGLPADRFSVRWKQSLVFSAGTYRYFTSTDDGVRVWVDNRLVVDAWFNQALPNTRSGDITLNPGAHEIRVEYYEDTRQAAARVWWERVEPYPTPGVPTIAGWRGEYFSNRDLVGSPALAREDPAIEFDWGTGSPASWIPSDNFSVRWTRQLTFSPGYYRFSVQSDDGVRVWVDNGLLIDRWYPMAADLHYVDGAYLSGDHQLKVEYFEQTGYASIRFWFSPGTGPGQPVPTPPPPAPGAALVDNSSTGFVKGGAATSWRTVAGGYGGSLIWTKNNDYARKNYNWARWYPDLAPGRYEVFVYVPEQYATTTNARYWVRHADGYTLVRVNQSANPSRWVSLGTYRFAGDDSEYISLSDITYERYLSKLIAFDAVRWEPR